MSVFLGRCLVFLGGVPGLVGGVYLVLGDVPGLGGCLLRGGVPGQVLPPVDRQTPVNILPCPKLRLRAVIIRCEFS